MKKVALFLVVAVLSISLIGCGKKKHEEAAMDGLNGVATENVVSVTDASGNPADANAVPVVVDNAPAAATAAPGEMAAVSNSAVATAGEKPTPKQIQQALKNAGLYNGKVDGTVGPKTKKAVEAFQSQNGLKADGKVGAKTWRALSAYLNKPAEVTNPSAEQQTVNQ